MLVLYDSLKIIHIFSATLLLAYMVRSTHSWITTNHPAKIQSHTLWIILPLALWQLFSGFTLISLHHENPAQLWVQMSFIGFMAAMISWLLFSYVKSRRVQFGMLVLCAVSVLVMIFAMSTKQ